MAVSLLNKTEYKVTDKVTVNIPTLGQYRSKTEIYDTLMNYFIVTPSNYMVQLYDKGIDFRKLDEYEFFLQLIAVDYMWNEPTVDSTILFQGLDFSTLQVAEDNGHIILVDNQGDTVIDEYVYLQVGALFCEILNTKKCRRKPKNQTAFDYIIDVEREHQKNAKRLKNKQQVEFDDLIVALVCKSGFPYNFETVNTLTLYDFYCCVQQIVKDTNYNNLMRGVYSGFGSVDLKRLNPNELNYLSFRK